MGRCVVQQYPILHTKKMLAENLGWQVLKITVKKLYPRFYYGKMQPAKTASCNSKCHLLVNKMKESHSHVNDERKPFIC